MTPIRLFRVSVVLRVS